MFYLVWQYILKCISEQIKKIVIETKEKISQGIIDFSFQSQSHFLRAVEEDNQEYLKIKPFKLHYTDLITRKEPYTNLSEKERKEIADNMFNIAINNEIILFAAVINKRLHRKKYSIPLGPDLLGLEFIIERFEYFLRRKNEFGIIILDEKEKKQNIKIRNFFQELRDYGTSYIKLEKVIECIFFTPTEYCYPLQLADFLAYALFSKYEHKKEDRFKQIKHKFDTLNGILVGLKVWEPEEW